MDVNRKPPSIIPMFLILVFFSLICIGSILVAADVQCATDIEQWAPLYPNGEIVSQEFDMIRPRALGESRIIQITDNDEETVKQFYRDNVIANMGQQQGRGLASTDYRVVPNPDGDGTQITISTSCGI